MAKDSAHLKEPVEPQSSLMKVGAQSSVHVKLYRKNLLMSREMSYIVILSYSTTLAGLLCSNWWAIIVCPGCANRKKYQLCWVVITCAVPAFFPGWGPHKPCAWENSHPSCAPACHFLLKICRFSTWSACPKPGAYPEEYQPLKRLLLKHPRKAMALGPHP